MTLLLAIELPTLSAAELWPYDDVDAYCYTSPPLRVRTLTLADTEPFTATRPFRRVDLN